MSWAETLKINSDTSKPLNELIVGEKVFCSSDSVIVVLLESRKSFRGGAEEFFGSFTPKRNGVIKIKADFEKSLASTTLSCKVYDVSGSEPFLVADEEAEETDSKTGTMNFDMTISGNRKFSFYFLANGSGLNYIKNLKICGQIIDANYFDYEVV